jgi:peptidoglycan hydrolase-like protein with peptidoglycan-binding domain
MAVGRFRAAPGLPGGGRVLLGVGLAAALLAVGGLIGASFVKSPQQLAADSAAPPPTTTTAKVVAQVLTSSVQMRGVIYPSTEYDVYASAPSSDSGSSGVAAAGATETGTGAAYISKLKVAAGAAIANGELLAEIDGEPLFVLTGSVPAWRDLTPGESGPDVTELQKALAALGYYFDGDLPGYFGSATEYAVSLYYEHLGYPAPSAGGVPMTDVLFLPSLPATVVVVNGAVGDQAGQPFLELAPRGSLALTGELPPAYAAQVKSGLKVSVYDEVTGIHATGTIAGIGTATTLAPTGIVVNVGGSTGSAGASGSGQSGSGSAGAGSSGGGSGSSSGATPFIPLTVQPVKPLAPGLNGENVLVTVQTGRTEGPVLTVPVAAIVSTASGKSYVTVVNADGKQTQVPVTPGCAGHGTARPGPHLPRAAAGPGAAPGRPGNRSR